MSKRMGMVINLQRCVGCRTCSVACKMEHDVPLGENRVRVLNPQNSTVFDLPEGKFPDVKMAWLTVPCQHCEITPCVDVCPTGASQIRDDGIVFIDQDKCIGCNYCIWTCPYDARYFDEEKKVVDKCTFCMERIDDGKLPMCAEACPARAITFGDLNDPDSEVYKIVNTKKVQVLKPEAGTKPSVYYII